MARPPNILLITSDQQHWNTLGVTNPQIRTPALDQLAAGGTRFDRAYCPNPVCSPTRASIITGQYPSSHGCWTVGVTLAEDVPTVGDALGRAGYFTSLVGKAHFQPVQSGPGQQSLEAMPTLRNLDFWRGFRGPWYGFEHIDIGRMHGDEELVGQHYAIWMEEKGLKNWRDYFRPWPPDPADPRNDRLHSWDLPEELHYTTWTAERTIASIERAGDEDRPFFIWSSFHDPHPPYIVPEPWASMYRPDEMPLGTLEAGEMELLPPHFGLTQQRQPDFSAWQETEHPSHGLQSHLVDDDLMRRNVAVYYGMISFMDQQIGRILQALERRGMADNTLVIFTTDHGHFLGQHGLTAKGPFHYEDLLRVPFLVRWPGRVPEGRICSALQSLVDLAPSFLSAAALEVPGIMQGVDQFPVWTGESASARQWAIVENRHQPTTIHLRTFIDERYKITVYRNHDYGELFDLQADPQERRNRWDDPEYAPVKCRMLQRLAQGEMQREPMRFPRVGRA